MQGLILDACIGITFGNAGRLELVSGLRSGRVVIGRRALMEITRAPARDAVHAAVDAGEIPIEAIDLSDAREQAALAKFDARRAFQRRSGRSGSSGSRSPKPRSCCASWIRDRVCAPVSPPAVRLSKT